MNVQLVFAGGRTEVFNAVPLPVGPTPGGFEALVEQVRFAMAVALDQPGLVAVEVRAGNVVLVHVNAANLVAAL